MPLSGDGDPRHLDDLERRMSEMRRSRDTTLHALNCRSHDITTCPRFRAIVGGVLDGSVIWPGDARAEGHGEHSSTAGPVAGEATASSR